MADRKLSVLTELAAAPASDDELYIRDVSEPAADESKRITASNLQDHTPKSHTLDSHSTKAHSELSDAPEGAHHTKFTTTEHSSIGNGAPHHTKYTDSNARSAAVSDTAYAGSWNGVTTIAPSKNAVYDKIETLGAATKEFFVPVTVTSDGGAMLEDNYYPLAWLDNAGDTCFTMFHVPSDFSSITEAVIIVKPQVTTANANWDIESGYAAVGESWTINEETDSGSTYNVVNNQMFEVDISGILSSLAAGDYVGIELRLATSTHNVAVLGVRLKYS